MSDTYQQTDNPPPGPWNDPSLDEWRCEECASVLYTPKVEQVTKVTCPDCFAEGSIRWMERLSPL